MANEEGSPCRFRYHFTGISMGRGFAKRTKDGPQARRLLALAAIYDGATRTDMILTVPEDRRPTLL
jgi:hypothetical protein